MVPMSITSPENRARERHLLARLLGLYAAQQKLYGEVLELSRRQLELVRRGAPLGEIRGILAAKRSRLETIGNLDNEEAENRRAWRTGRQQWSASARAQMQRSLSEVGRSIEEILACEEENDRELVQHCR